MTFDEFWKELNDNWRRAGTTLPPPSFDYARQKFTERYPDKPAIFSKGPTRGEWRDQVRESMPDAPLEEIDAKYDEYYSDSAWREAGRGLKRGMLRLGESMAGITDVAAGMFGPMLGNFSDQTALDPVRERLGSMADEIPKSVSAQTPVWDEPAQLANPNWWAANLPEVATSQLPVVGGFLAGGPIGAGAVGAAMEGESTYRSAEEQGLGAPGLRGAGMGAAAGVLNAIPFAGKGSNILMRALAEGATEAAEEVPGTFLEAPVPRSAQEALQTLKEAGKRAAEVAPLATVTGGAMNVPAIRKRTPASVPKAETTQFKAEIQQAIENRPTIDPRLADDAHRVDLQIKQMEVMPQMVPTPAPAWMADIGADRAQVGMTIQKALKGDPMARAEREILSKIMDKSEVAQPPNIIRSPGGKQRGAIGRQPGSLKLPTPVHFRDGSRISGFTDSNRRVAYGFDHNGEAFTVEMTQLNLDEMVADAGRSGRGREKAVFELRLAQDHHRRAIQSPGGRQRGAIGSEPPTGPAKAKPAPYGSHTNPDEMVTLYRGEGGAKMGSVQGGDWWTTDPDLAASFGKVRSITLPARIVYNNFAQGHGGPTEFVFAGSDRSILQSSSPIAPDVLEMGQGRIKARKFSAVGDDGLMILQQVADDWGGEIDAQRRGRRSWSTTETAAVERLSDATGLPMKELLNRRTGSAANAEQLESFSKIIVEQTKRVQEKARAIKDGKDSSEDLVEFRTLMDELAVLQAPFAGYVAEAGRALNIMRKVTSGSRDAKTILETMSERGDIRKMAEKVADAKDAAKITARAREDFKPGFWDKVIEFRTAMLLTGLRTHIVNTMGNLSMIGAEAAVQVGAPVFRGQSVRQSLATLQGMGHGVMLGLRNAARAAITEEPQLEPMTKFDTPHTKAIKGPHGKLVRLSYRALTAEDEFFKGIGFMGRLYGVANREAEALGGTRAEKSARADDFVRRIQSKMAADQELNEQETKLVKEAVDYARHITFQTPLGPSGGHFQAMMNRHKYSRLVVPFFRTPVNLVKVAGEYSPFGFVKAVKGKDSMTAEERGMALTRATIGSAVATYVWDLAASGMLSGLISDDDRERDLHQIATGKLPYSYRDPETGQWYSYLRMDPFSIQVGLIADMYTLRNYASADEFAKIPVFAAMSLMENLGNKTWLTGVADFVEFLNEPSRYGENYLQGMAASFIPAAMSQAASNMDPYYRQAKTLLDQVKKRVPQKRQELAVAMNVAGQPMPNAYQSYVPFSTVPPSNDILAAKMLEVGMLKDKPGSKLLNTELTPEEYESYSRFVGQMRWNAMTPLAMSPEFNRLPHPFQLQILEKLWDSTGYQARQAWLINNPEFMVKAAKQEVEQLAGTAGP